MENEANGVKKDHVISKNQWRKMDWARAALKSRERSKYMHLWYANDFSDRNGMAVVHIFTLVMKGYLVFTL